LEDRTWFKKDEFAPDCLLQRRLLVQRAVRGSTGVEEERIQFRHDRVWDFFLAAAFLDDPDLWAEHLDDPRFRGVYLRIAETWPPGAAAKVRDRLAVTAAKTGVLGEDAFVQGTGVRVDARSWWIGKSLWQAACEALELLLEYFVVVLSPGIAGNPAAWLGSRRLERVDGSRHR
jgi:hypothetical protein